MRRYVLLCGVLLAPWLLAGCVERKYLVVTDPPGATVLVTGHEQGTAPYDGTWTYYGTYDFTFEAPGYQTLKVRQPIPAPWYEWPGIDFFSENLVPWTIHDNRRFGPFPMQPVQQPDINAVVQRAVQLQAEGQKLGAPPTTPPVAVAPLPTPPPPPGTPPPVPPIPTVTIAPPTTSPQSMPLSQPPAITAPVPPG